MWIHMRLNRFLNWPPPIEFKQEVLGHWPPRSGPPVPSEDPIRGMERIGEWDRRRSEIIKEWNTWNREE